MFRRSPLRQTRCVVASRGFVHAVRLRGIEIPAIVFAGHQAARQRRPRRDGNVKGLGEIREFALCRALHQAVLDLHGVEARPAAKVGEGIEGGGNPGGNVGEAGVVDLPCPHQVVQAARHLFDAGGVVPHVDPQEVDIVGAQPLERRLHAADQVFTMIPRGIGVLHRREAVVERILRAHHEVIAVGRNQVRRQWIRSALPDSGWRCPGSSAGFDEGVEDAPLSAASEPRVPQAVPKVPAPRHSSETRSPLLPRSLYRILVCAIGRLMRRRSAQIARTGGLSLTRRSRRDTAPCLQNAV